ncbi:large conductance mechanosensitive channel protein MscL [Candidatus Bipolaricaulota bacterium]|nr:large conductance mechanosensitive channel protein MscL [Candidatus Bipolaricaulota bacterium]
MRKEFRDFILKGNLLQVAVAFIMGAAFGAVVRSLVNDLIMPIIGKLIGNVDFTNLYINLSGQVYESAAAARDAGAAAIYYGSFINEIVSFLIIGLVLFLIVRGAMRLQKPAEDGPPTEKECPRCKSTIAIEATRCPNCTSELGGLPQG